MIRICALALCLAFLSACGSEDAPKPAGDLEQQGELDSEPSSGGGANPPPPPDAGTATGHAADPRRVRVPERDSSPPTATIAIAAADGGRTLADASRPGSPPSGAIELTEPRLRGTAVGEDETGGIVRVRVSISERISCRGDGDARFERVRTRYFPPPQIERIRATPGARLPTRATRSRLLALAGERCGAGAEAGAVEGKLWAEVINGDGLETISPPVRFTYRP